MDARSRQLGTTTVEFALVGLLVIMLLFAVLEFGRVVFTLNMLQEGARRAARVAAVCAVGDPAVANAAVFADLPGFSTSNVVVEYLNQNGAPTGNFSSIRYVRVRIVNYSFPIAIPLITPTLDAPEFSSTLPRESLGIPHFGAAPAC
jgi:Flp pilus assembly protein TadG